MDSPVTGAIVVALTSCWRQVPQKSMAQHSKIKLWAMVRHTSLPGRGSFATKASMPRWEPSRIATTAPMKVSQTKKYRDNSSDTSMPELNT